LVAQPPRFADGPRLSVLTAECQEAPVIDAAIRPTNPRYPRLEQQSREVL
jgi:hypothetical protein